MTITLLCARGRVPVTWCELRLVRARNHINEHVSHAAIELEIQYEAKL